MTKITATVRTTIRNIIAARDYDADTMRIGRDGVVSALKDADKTFAGNDPARYTVGHVDQLLADSRGI